MFVLYAFLVALFLTGFSLLYIKTYQLEGYKLKRYLFKVLKLNIPVGDKNILVFTKRVKRLIFFGFLVNFAIFLLIFVIVKVFWVNILLVVAFVLFGGFVMCLTYLIEWPCECLIRKFYIQKAKKKLKKLSCKKIAITGSFGKTSTKNFLYQILSEEFDVCATPQSFNTPMGVCRAILENLKETDDFFIVEMGARHLGDIEYLAKFVGVDYGIITPIGNCHLETFGSLENIENEKYKLCKEAKNCVVFNGKNSSTKKLWKNYPQRKYLVCEKGSFAYAKKIKITEKGSDFVCVLNGNEFQCQTSLLGESNIDNIVVASAMAYLLGESLFSIKEGIRKIKAVPHRLELIRGEVVNVIDDSYNSNFDGFRQALDVLAKFKGKKIVVSPGIVELGKEQYQINLEAGREVGKVADLFLIMNETNRDSLFEGAKQSGMNEGQIYFAKTRNEQKEILKKIISQGDVVLFENDLPDNFR